MGRQGGFGFFLQEGGKGTVKLQKEPKQIKFFLGSFGNFFKTCVILPFYAHFLLISVCSREKIFL